MMTIGKAPVCGLCGKPSVGTLRSGFGSQLNHYCAEHYEQAQKAGARR